ncbi:MAG: HD domain-containing protein [Lachnospiraceae bacterium]|nr:HD domain-containing protein [Lachnospiraceae bacterium]
MKRERKGTIESILTDTVRLGSLFILAVTVIIMIIAAIDKDTAGEASIGSFASEDFSNDWTLMFHGERQTVDLPMNLECEKGDELILSKDLPGDLCDGMSIMMRASMEDASIYIGGKLREVYSSNSIEGLSYYPPSAYIVTQVGSKDAGKDIAIHLTIKNKGTLNPISLNHGNNGWFEVLRNSLLMIAIAAFVLLCGITISLSAFISGKGYKTEAAGYLGLLIFDAALWLISESVIRQLVFFRPSMSQYFSYFSFELIAPFACMYFDAVQHKIYHRRYLVIESISLAALIVNVILDASDILRMFQTVPVCHVLAGISIVMVLINIITDYRHDRLKSYRISCIGILIFLLLALVELSRFYFPVSVVFGTYLSLGLIGLMVATLLQTLNDILEEYREREKKKTAMTISTIETIAGAIDARDEYTGGHSERVGLYSQRLAREMAADYELTEEDIVRIHYIGLVHDIGKIGVADNVLNKSGKLNDEEYTLMRRHTEIGYEIMASLGSEINGLLDGIRHHHERFDGDGYPDKLSGTDIPLVARILALADSYDAMTSNRVYRKRLSDEEVRAELVRCSGTQFDPALTEIFIKLLDKGELSADIKDGIATDSEGRMRTSSVLEDMLSRDLMNEVKVNNPSHVRMLCYILKLMEKKEKSYKVLLIRDDSSDEPMSAKTKTAIKELFDDPHDVIIRYTSRSYIAALYDRSVDHIYNITHSVKEKCPSVDIRVL